MKYTEGGRAWQFLLRNPEYIVDWWIWAAGRPPPQGDPFPIRTQTREEEKAAARWGVLAWEDPLAGDGALSPFWQAAPTLEAVAVPGNPIFTELLETPGARLSGVRMSDGATVLKAEEGNASVQLRIADGDSFDFTCGVALVIPRLPDMRVRLRRAADLWPIGASNEKRRASGCRTGSFSWRWTCRGPAIARARSARPFASARSRRPFASARSTRPSARRVRSRRGRSGRTARCGRWRGGELRRLNG